MSISLSRRKLIAALAGSAVAWPPAARAQKPDRVPRIGVLIAVEDDPVALARVAAFRQELEKLGWKEGRNVRVDARFAAGDSGRIQSYAAELAGLKPDVALVQTSIALTAMLRESPSLPLVFVQVNDPVDSGFVTNLAHPGGNITGFTPAESSMAAKMLEILKDVAPHVSHVTVLLSLDQVPGVKAWHVIQAVAPTVDVHVVAADIHEPSDIKRAVESCADQPGGGLIVLASLPTIVHRKVIIELAARHRLPAVYTYAFHAREGGLVSYGVELAEQYRQAASYVDRILKGAKPGDLPVQQPTKFELLINLKTANALGITVPNALLAVADEVIE
jgi:putative tryptophan/tyrosine transport system substrate-binding protein